MLLTQGIILLSLSKIKIRQNRQLCVYHKSDSKAKKSILFIHDLGGRAYDWQSIWRNDLSDYNIVSYDLMGHGCSEKIKVNSCSYSLMNLVMDGQSVIEHFLKNDNYIIIVGMGYSCRLVYELALIYGFRIKKIILIDLISLNKSRYLFQVYLEYFFRKDKKQPLSFNIFRACYKSLKKSKIVSSVIHHKCLVIDSISNKKSYLEVNEEDRFNVQYLDSLNGFYTNDVSDSIYHYIKKFINKIDLSAFRNLVFEGAGIRGISYCGALMSLDKMGVLSNIKRVAGSSSGSIYATFMALGYSTKEIYSIVKNLNFSDLKSSSGGILKTGARFLSDYGWYKGDRIINIMGDLIKNKTGNSDINFKELHDLYKFELYIIGTNLSYNCHEIYSYKTTPKMKIKDAVRISTSIPIWYEVVRRNDDNSESILVDGGLSWNYPIDIFDYEDDIENNINMGRCVSFTNKKKRINYETLGFRLEPEEDPLYSISASKNYMPINNWVDYAKSFLKFMHASSMKRHMCDSHWVRTIHINTLDIGGSDFDISQVDKDRLINEGKTGVYKHFAWRMGKDGLNFPQ